jgi:hypothetical protein
MRSRGRWWMVQIGYGVPDQLHAIWVRRGLGCPLGLDIQLGRVIHSDRSVSDVLLAPAPINVINMYVTEKHTTVGQVVDHNGNSVLLSYYVAQPLVAESALHPGPTGEMAFLGYDRGVGERWLRSSPAAHNWRS